MSAQAQQNYIADSVEVFNPYSGLLVGSVMETSPYDISSAVGAAKRAWLEFRSSTPFERKSLLYKLADLVAQNAEEIAQIICSEVGKTIVEARNEVRRAQNTLRLSGDATIVLHGEVMPTAVVAGSPDKMATITYESTGVLGAITPFNYPLNLLCHKLGPAIAAGNAVVAKPSPKAPLAADALQSLANEAGFPKGLFTVVHGGSAAAIALAQSEIDLLSFTGGPQAGLALKRASGLVRCLMELGGNDPLIVMPDADLERAADVAVGHRLEIAGQSCAAVKRLFLHEAVQDEMIERIATRIDSVVLGDPSDQRTIMGPVIDENAATEVQRRVSKTLDQGARLVRGGKRDRAVFEPTLIKDVPADSELTATETFGPVISAHSFTDITAVISEVSNSPYGLQAGIFTNDHSLIRKVGRDLCVGGVMVNEGPDFRAENVPFGGRKTSGLGREGIHMTLREMSEIKVVID